MTDAAAHTGRPDEEVWRTDGEQCETAGGREGEIPVDEREKRDFRNFC